jgi:hypothetical protein
LHEDLSSVPQVQKKKRRKRGRRRKGEKEGEEEEEEKEKEEDDKDRCQVLLFSSRSISTLDKFDLTQPSKQNWYATISHELQHFHCVQTSTISSVAPCIAHELWGFCPCLPVVLFERAHHSTAIHLSLCFERQLRDDWIIEGK